jgi:hypothetical protein
MQQLNVLIPNEEVEFLEKYCDETGTTRSIVITKLIKRLKARVDALDSLD